MKKILLILFAFLASSSVFAQTNLDSLWGVWNSDSDDSLRLEAIADITKVLRRSNPDSAYVTANLMIDLGQSEKSNYHIGKALNIQASIDKSKGDYAKALNLYEKCLEIAKPLKNRIPYAATINNIAIVYKHQGNLAKAIEMYTQSIQVRDEIGDMRGKARTLNNIGIIYNDQGDRAKALEYYLESFRIKEDLDDAYGLAIGASSLGGVYSDMRDFDNSRHYLTMALTIAEENNLRDFEPSARINVGKLHHKLGDYEKAKEYFEQAGKLAKELGDKRQIAGYHIAEAELNMQLGKYAEAIPSLEAALELNQALGIPEGIRETSLVLYSCYKEVGQIPQALKTYELFILMRDSLKSETNQREILRQEYKYEYEKEALTDSLQFAKKEAVMTEQTEKQQIGLFAAAGGLFLLVSLAFAIYRGKKRSDELLLNILPEETAKELKQKGHSDAKLIDEVTVIFTDFKGFTAMSEQLSPKDLVQDLNICFSEFDRIMDKYGIEKIKTIGDAYMAAGGLPTPNATHATDALNAAMEMRDFVEAGKAKKIEADLPYFEIRIGVHTGPVVAGIVGIKKFQYDIWGDTVNTASRMESSGEVGKVNVSESTYELVKDQFNCEFRGEIEAKGKGKVKMYFVS